MALTGKDGNVSLDSGISTVAEIKDWSLDESADVLETTSFDNTDDHKTYIAGLKDTTGSFSGQWEASQMADTTPGTTITVQLDIDATNYVSGSAIISNRSSNTAVDGLAEVSIDFQFAAAPVWTTA